MTPATERVGTTLDGKLRIERLLASGAAGDVFEAHHLGLGTQVAVKVLRPGGGETADIRRRRFLREARVAARLRSPYVVRVFDVVEGDGGLTYIVMELLHGETLAERLGRDGRLPVRDAVRFVRQATHALAEMHDAGIIHRDIKPSNLFLEQEADGSRKVKLLDFGVAALRQPLAPGESSITYSEAFIGTPRYMAPEQVRSSKTVDARADVWALAVTLYELLTCAPPFDGQTVIAVLNQIERGSPPPLEQLRPELPDRLVTLIRRGMSRDPDERPANARAFGEELDPLLEPDGPRAGSAPAPSRRRIALLAGSMVAVTFLVLLGMRRAGDARPTATAEITADAPASAPPAPATIPVASSDPVAPAASVQPAPVPPPTRVDATARPRSRPAPSRPSPAPRPTRETDDRIE
jgi:serine/threonine-protein kinase